MNDLIEALTILAKYGNPNYPTHCEHDSLYVDIAPELVSKEDIIRLEELGFMVGEEEFEGGFFSYRFGSC